MLTSTKQTVVAIDIPAPEQAPRQERLSGSRVFDANGNLTQPSLATPFEPPASIPTMLTPRELNYLRWLASSLPGEGRIVELGCFLGGSTAALLDGRRANAGLSDPVLTYDAFNIEGKVTPDLGAWLESCGVTPGRSFRPRFDALVNADLGRLQ